MCKERVNICIYVVFFHSVLKQLFVNVFEQSLGVFRFETSGFFDNSKH